MPDDALFVVTVNADEVLSQLDYSQDGDKASFCPEFKTALEKMGVKTSDSKAMGQFLALVEHQMVVFGEDKEVYLSFLIKDEEGFMKWFTENTKEKFTEEDGFQVADSHLAIKNGQAWVSDSKIDTGDLKDFLDEGDDCFAKKYEKIASEMCKKENVVYAFANIDELMSFLRKSGESSVPEMQLVLNTAFKDPAFATGYVTLSDSEVTGTITVLNYQMEPAEFLLPTGKSALPP